MLNKIILMGRLTKDPELRHTANNTPVTSFTLAVDRGTKKEGQQNTDFLDIVAWDARADFAAKYFRKGQLVAVCGKLQTRKWTDNNGNNRTAYEVIADELHFAESKQQTQPQTSPYTAPKPVPIDTPIVMPPDQYEVYGGFIEDLDASDELPY